jgi:hypothetical protein
MIVLEAIAKLRAILTPLDCPEVKARKQNFNYQNMWRSIQETKS